MRGFFFVPDFLYEGTQEPGTSEKRAHKVGYIGFANQLNNSLLSIYYNVHMEGPCNDRMEAHGGGKAQILLILLRHSLSGGGKTQMK